ncbi:hypothetical protein PoB_001730600 [Plakobranchus ocellatus]|uniref:Uncharacterized protein n=1 Tax=Plakobranchus ocellatus TaxID=259542 RepID=A0AAV3YUP0_9GAST|nr:hypothetical protein PoB_001730600 [Plakobranchus ocellatus]
MLSQAISEKATFLSKAILAIPKHLDKHNEDCCFSVNTRYSDNLTRLPEAESSLPSEWEDFTKDIGFLTVETYEEDEAPVIFVDGEGIEVVLSSNPESEGYGSELHPVLELHTNTKPFCEEFTKHSCESAISLEEPMIAEESRDTTSQLVIPASNLVTKFKSLALQDPLRKENGDLWKEEDFFQVIYSNGVYEPPDNQAKAELFCDPEFKKNVTDIGLELLMTPILSKRIPDTFRAEMCEPESIRSLLGISSDQKTLPLHVTMSAVLDNHVEYKKSSCLARLENCESVTDDIDLQRVFHKMSHTDDFPCFRSLLESPDNRSIECNMWLKEKYNDLLRIPEPNVDVPKKPANILQEVIESLNPRADTEISLVPELFTECPPVSIPLLNIDDSVMIYELPSTKPPEEFKKMEHFERECSSPAVEKSDCPPQFESLRRDTQNDTVNLGIQELMKRNFWTQPVDEFNNPLEFFLALRKEAKLKEKALTSPADDNDCKSAIGSEERRNVQPNKKLKHNVGEGFEIRIVPAPFIGPMENILQCVVDCSAPYMAYMKLAQHISPEETFMNISVDSTQFLFKECEKSTQDQQSSDNASLQSALCLNTLRTAADYLVNVDLEVCCVYLVSQADQWKKYLKDSLDVVLEKMCQMQAEVLKNNILHPKLEALWLEVNRFCSRFSGRKLLIVIPRGFPTLLQTVKSMLCKIPQLTVTVLPDFGSEPGQSSSCNMACIIQYVESMPAACLSQFSMVIQYDDTIGDFFKTACKKQEHSYIGLVTEVTVTPTNNDPAKLDKYQVPFPLICTAEVSQNKQLLYLLEARYSLGKAVVANLHKLRASLSNLTKSSDYFAAHYKILIRQTEADVAACIRSLSDTLIRSQRESDTGRSWIEADMSKQEEALLQIPCLNPLSAQILLGQMKSVDILDMPFEDLRKAAPELPESIVKWKACRGIAAFIRKDLRATVQQTPSLSDVQEVKVWWGGKKYQLWNWYQPPSDKSVSFDLGNGTHRFTHTLMAGDANAHHLAFRFENSDVVGEWVVDLMIGSNLTSLVTERSKPTYLHSRGGLFCRTLH